MHMTSKGSGGIYMTDPQNLMAPKGTGDYVRCYPNWWKYTSVYIFLQLEMGEDLYVYGEYRLNYL